MDDDTPGIAFVPLNPVTNFPYPEINDYSYRRLAPGIRSHYRPSGPMAPGGWIFTGAPADVPRAVFRP